MTFKVVILRSAEADLRELRRYLNKRFGPPAWDRSYAQIKQASHALPRIRGQASYLMSCPR